jgi:flagellar motor switch/type III secretory pathway protein FliN
MVRAPHTYSIDPYPWSALERISRSAARCWRQLQRRLHADAMETRVTEALSGWMREPVHLRYHAMRELSAEPDGPSARLRLRLPANGGELTLCIDEQLVSRLVGHVLNRDVSLQNPLSDTDPCLLGVMAAIATKVAEDAGLGMPIEIAHEPMQFDQVQRVQLDYTLHIGSSAYTVVVGAVVPWRPTAEPTTILDLELMGQLPIRVPVVVGVSAALREELALLAPGTAYMSGAGLWIDQQLVGHGVFIAPECEWGWSVALQSGGKIVLDDHTVMLKQDEPRAVTTSAHSSQPLSLADTLLDVPVIVRVEVGCVTLPARQWAALRPGDVIETGQLLGEPVTLRVAGETVATGELVNVDGELGVRISRLLVGGQT